MSGEFVISWVGSALDTDTHDIGVEAVLEAIRAGRKRLKGQVTQIRNRFEAELDITGDLQKAKGVVEQPKKALPAVMWCGQFSNREKPAADKLQEHSGLLCADLDELGSELPRVREQLQPSPHLFALFLSPTAYGLKAVFRVSADASKHAGSFRAVQKHVLELTGVQIDESGKDVSRLCFLSYDPDLYYNPDAIQLEPLPELLKRKARVSDSTGDNSKPDKAEVRKMLAVIPKRPHYHDWIKLVAAVGDALPNQDAIELLNEWSPEEARDEYAKKLASGFEKIHVGTLIRLAQQHGWTPKVDNGEKRPDLWQGPEVEPNELPLPAPPYVPPR
jgi:hypothetical protein